MSGSLDRIAAEDLLIRALSDPSADLGAHGPDAWRRALAALPVRSGARPALHHAVAAGRLDLIDFALQHGYPVDRHHAGVTALHFAVYYLATAAAQRLILHGADPLARPGRSWLRPGGYRWSPLAVGLARLSYGSRAPLEPIVVEMVRALAARPRRLAVARRLFARAERLNPRFLPADFDRIWAAAAGS